MNYDYDFEPLNAVRLGATWRKARKEHTCQCGDPIKKGQRYSREFWKVEGSLEITKVGDHTHSFEKDEDWGSDD